MKNNKDKKHLDSEEEKAMFSNLEFSYSRSKEDVWNQLDALIEEEGAEEDQETTVISLPDHVEAQEAEKTRKLSWGRLSVAASLLVLLSAGLFTRFYTRTIAVEPGEFVSHTLPDGSEVHLNAATSIKYQPYWWKINRGVELKGEAYFVVAKGEKFTVNSTMGSVEVLGTEFNVYARGDDFQVFCEEGRVKVSSDKLVSASQENVILTQGHFATIELNQMNKPVLVKQEESVPEDFILSWRSGRFMYNNTPLSKVFEDIERQYGISILLKQTDIRERPYSGSFSRELSLEDALDSIVLSMGLNYETTQNGIYMISKK